MPLAPAEAILAEHSDAPQKPSEHDAFLNEYLQQEGYITLKGRRTPQQKRSIRQNNAILCRVFTEGDRVGKLIAKTRWVVLRKTREGFAALAGLHKSTPAHVEEKTKRNQPNQSTHHTTYALMVKCFQDHGVDERIVQALLRELLGEDAGTTIGTYREWAYRLGFGPEEFEEKTGMTYGCLWQRRCEGFLPPFSEIIDTARRLGITPKKKDPSILWGHPELAKARETWVQENVQKFQRPRSISTLHAALHTAGYRTDGPSLQKFSTHLSNGDSGLTYEHAKRLALFQPVPWESISVLHAPLLSILGEQGYADLKVLWQEEEQKEHNSLSFQEAFERIRDERGFTNNKLARILDVKMYKPSQAIRTVVEGESIGYKTGVSRGVLARILDPNPNGANFAHLKTLDRTERLQRRKKKASRIDHDVRSEREWWGVTPDQIQARSGYSKSEFLKIEQGTLPISGNTREQLVGLIQDVGEERAKTAIERLQKHTKPETVSEALTLLAKDAGGYDALARLIKKDIPTRTAPETLKRIAKGEVVPSLPLLKHIVEVRGALVTPKLQEDWSLCYAEQCEREGDTLLARILHTIIAEVSPSVRHFCRGTKVMHPHFATRLFQRINRGEDIDVRHIDRILCASGCQRNSARWIFVHAIVDQKSLERAIEYSLHILDGKLREVTSPSSRTFPGLATEEMNTVQNSVALHAQELQRSKERLFTRPTAPTIQKVSHEPPMDPRLRSILEWAASYNAPIAEHYGTIQLDAEQSLKEGMDIEEIKQRLRHRIDSIALRQERMNEDGPRKARFTQKKR